MSGVPLEPVYGPEGAELPGQYPYTRGPYASMYRSPSGGTPTTRGHGARWGGPGWQSTP
jgi:hypothetical protein